MSIYSFARSLFITFKKASQQLTDARPQTILAYLRKTYALPSRKFSTSDPFRTLIATIISQHTADGNTERAFADLSERFRITPKGLANANAKQIEQTLKVAGLYRNKARIISRASRKILDEYGGDLMKILILPLEEARNALMNLPGVGPKTADVVLLFSASRPTIPVDTHVNRVAKRLGLAPAVGDYEEVRGSLQACYDPRDYLAVHMLLISHGRECCKARKAICGQCTIRLLCPSSELPIQ